MSNLLETLNKIKEMENRQLEIIKEMRKAIREAIDALKKMM